MRIFNNFFYKVAALLVAVVLWAAAQGIRSDQRGLDIPVAFEGVPEDLVVVEQSARQINVQIVGSRAAVQRAERQISRYPIYVRGARPGTAHFPVEPDRLAVPRGASVTSRSPAIVEVRFEPRARKRVPVRADLSGGVPEGFELVRVEVLPDEVVLEGAQGALRRIREVLTEPIPLETLRTAAEEEVRLALGSDHVWRVEPEGPIRVRLEVRQTRAGDGSGRGSPEEGEGTG